MAVIASMIFLLACYGNVYAYGTDCNDAETIKPGKLNNIRKGNESGHTYQIWLTYGQTLRVRLTHKNDIRSGLLGIQLLYKGGYYVMSGCRGGTPYKEGQLIVTTDPCEYYVREKTLVFRSYGDGYYVIHVYGIRNSTGTYDLEVDIE